MWVIVAPADRDAPVPGVNHMTRLASSSHIPLWTDDYSNLDSHASVVKQGRTAGADKRPAWGESTIDN